MTAHAELITRLEAATGPDREIDLDIAVGLKIAPGGEKWERRNGRYDQGGSPHLRENRAPDPGPWPTFSAQPYTASVDAALALLERVLPGWAGMVSFGPSEMQRADVWGPVKEIGEAEDGTPVEMRDDGDGEAPTPAIALCIAVLRALEAQP